MPTPSLSETDLRACLNLVEECRAEGFELRKGGGLMEEAGRRAVERGLVRTIKNFGSRVKAAKVRELVPKLESPLERPVALDIKVEPQSKSGRVFLLTAAQDNTPVVDAAWHNLSAYAEHRGAEILVGGFTYQKGLFEENRVSESFFDSRIDPLLRPEVVELTPGLIWYGRANILPTATDPLSGWDTQTRDQWAIFPHAKIALKSVPVMPGRRPKQIMTTGVITKPNYVQRNAGQKAEFHHTIGALIVEVTSDGRFFCRQLSCRSDGSFQDLDAIVADGKVTTGHAIEALTAGDIHAEMLDPDVARATWGLSDIEHWSGPIDSDNILDVLRPRYQFVHDAFDFTARSHHTRNDPHERAMRINESMDEVEEGVRRAADVIRMIHRPFCTTVNVASNHLLHMDKWLKDPKGAEDPVNAYYWHRLNAAYHDAIRAGDTEFQIHEHAMRSASGDNLDGVTFLREGQSFLICQTTAPIECGLHGDRGPRGARGSAPAFAKIVERVNLAHTHEPRILEAAYYAGTSGDTNPRFASKAPGAWQPAHILTYASGKRCIVTLDGSRWRG